MSTVKDKLQQFQRNITYVSGGSSNNSSRKILTLAAVLVIGVGGTVAVSSALRFSQAPTRSQAAAPVRLTSGLEQKVSDANLEGKKTRVIIEFQRAQGVVSGKKLTIEESDQNSQKFQATADSIIGQLPAGSYQVMNKFTTIPFMTLDVTPGAIAKLKTVPEVISISENFKFEKLLRESKQQIEAINLQNNMGANDLGYNGAGYYVAVLDDGIVPAPGRLDSNNGGLGPTQACFTVCPTENVIHLRSGGVMGSSVATCVGCSGNHGSYVSDIIAGRDTSNSEGGVAEAAGIIPVKIGNVDPPFFDLDQIVTGMEWVLGMQRGKVLVDTGELMTTDYQGKIAAINLSVGQYFLGGATAPSTYPGNCDADHAAMRDMVVELNNEGIFTITTGGGFQPFSGTGVPEGGGYPDKVIAFGCVSGTVPVGAVRTDNSIGWQTNRTTALPMVLAPGQDITTRVGVPGGGLGFLPLFTADAGQSLSVPHVAGTYALIRQAVFGLPTQLNNAQLADIVRRTGTPIVDEGHNGGDSNGDGQDDFYNDDVIGTGAAVFTTTEIPNLNTNGSPASNVPNDNFMVVWSGEIEAPASGPANFSVNTNGGYNLWFDGELIEEKWTLDDSGNTQNVLTLTRSALEQGRKYPITVAYHDTTGDAVFNISLIVSGASPVQPTLNAKYYAKKGNIYPLVNAASAIKVAIRDSGGVVASKSLNFDYPVKSGNNRVLVVSAAYQHGSVPDLNNTRLTGVTYGGVAMQPLLAITPTTPRANVSSHTDPSGVTRSTEMWYLLNPPVGTQAVNATFGADPGEKNLMATTLFDVDYTSPFGVPGKSSAGLLNPNSVGFPGNGYGIGNIGSANLPGCDTTAKCKILGVYATDLSNGTNAARAATATETFTKKPVSGLYSKQIFSTGAGETGKLGVFLTTSEGINKTTSSGDAIQTLLRTPKTLGFSAVGFFWKELKTASTPAPATPTPTPTLVPRPTGSSTFSNRGWTATYFPNITFSGGGSNSLNNLIGVSNGVNYDFGTGNPVGKYGFNFSLTFPSDNFTASYYGRIKPTVAGVYSFKTEADDTAVFSIINSSNTETILINGNGTRTANYNMTVGQTYAMYLKYTERTGNAKIKLFWKTPGTTTFVPIPADKMEQLDNSWMMALSSGTSTVVTGQSPQNSCDHTVRFVNKPNDGVQNVMDIDAIIENNIVIEEDSVRIKRDTTAAWTLTCGATASGDCLYFTRTNAGGVEFKTTAQKITYLGRRGDKQGSMQVYVDGVLKGTYNRYATSYVGQQPIDVSLTNLTCPTSGSTPPPTGGGSSLVAIADSSVRSTEASTNFGTRTTLDVGGSPLNLSYFKFNLAGLSGSSISSAKLRVRVNNGSTNTQSIKQVNTTSWSETGITYNNRPAVGTVVGTNNGGAVGEWKEADITAYVKSKAGSVISLAVDQTGGDGFAMYSRESADKPTIIVNSSGTTPPPPSAPVVNLTANGSGGPITVAANSSVNLAWSTSNASSCSASASVATTNWSGSKGISGALAITIGTSRTLTLTCTGTGGTTSDAVTINVTATTATPTPPPITSQSVYLSFDGVDDTATVLNSTSLNLPSSDVSMSLWVNRGSGGGTVQSLMGKAFGTAASYGMDLENGVPRVGIRSDSGLVSLSDTAVVVPVGVWTHVATSIDDTGSGVSVSLYVNGVLRWTKTSNIRVGSSTSNIFIGQRPGGGNYFKGFMDDIRIYARVLSTSEMTTLNSKGNPSTTNLRGHFRFNEASGQSIIDSSTSGNTGFLGGSTNGEASDPIRTAGGIN